MQAVASRGAALLLIVLVTLFGCRGPDDSWEGRQTHDLQGVVLVLLDTVRADRLGCYGYDRRPTSPNLDALAAGGVRFSQTVASAPWTLPSVASILAGQYSERVFKKTLSFSVVDALHDAGIETAAFTEGGFVSKAFDFDRGFDQWVEEEGEVQLLKHGQARDPNKSGGIERTFAAAERWLGQRHPGRFFLLVHTYEAHTPYESHAFTEGLDAGRVGEVFSLSHVRQVEEQKVVLTDSETEYIGALYDGDIASADRHVGRLIRKIEKLGMADRVAVIVTSDHGEELGRHYPHNTGDHGHALLDTMMLVPLIVHDPTKSYAGSVIDAQVRTVDILPTVADLMQVPLEAPLDGRSLLPLMRGDETDERVALMGQTKAGPVRVGVRSLAHKYISTVGIIGRRMKPLDPLPPPRQLYDLTADPEELENLVELRPELAATLDELVEATHPGKNVQISPELADEVDAELLERLRSLGYVD